jgi:hypothetical protein
MEREPIYWSPKYKAFLESFVESSSFPKMTKAAAVFNVMTTTPRPSDPEMTMLDQAIVCDKLHDGEPAVIYHELEKRWPDFFAGIPIKQGGRLTDTIKGQFISRFITIYLYGGISRYIKEKRRKHQADVMAIS